MQKITYDLAKSTSNFLKHGLHLADAVRFDFGVAVYYTVDASVHGESRVKALGLLDGAVHAFIFTMREDGIRAISLRRANRSERRRHEKEKAQPKG